MKADVIPDELLEKLAEQVHVTWMKNRLNEGWAYGLERDDKNKTTPCLVPYDELPEIEKQYDRNTVKATIEALNGLGFSIVKKE